MKTIKTAIALFVTLLATTMNAQDKPKSPAETASGKIGKATVTINYGAPSVRDREIWGKLVPFGEVWRAGANDATTFETDNALTIDGKELPAGKYSLFVIPEKDQTATVIFNKESKQWGAYKYDASKDALRVKVKAAESAKTEQLTYKVNAKGFALSWDKWTIPVTAK
ncbi:DUF2911 domain-containing protein [Flavobacterium sp.]|uniref:DUF2911 domain-containing protein n=1 Tax=Flavobacterium sp. TaxID=239 RepID=UPI00120D9D77|nr:DUF2911 domain-containing protein [Flavobacterium sp.]RZJ70403.1 MAG: DUF2911 domain-containing protein [Flavobacterium sp.]